MCGKGDTPPDAETEWPMALVPWKWANPWVNTRDLTKRDIIFCGRPLVIEQRPGDHIDVGKNTGLLLWDGCYVLARLMEQRPSLIRGRRVLDLGAGTGLLTLVAWLLGPAKVIATEIGDAIDLLKANIGANTTSLAKATAGAAAASAPPEVAEMMWGTPPPPEVGTAPFDVVLCSELIYDAGSHSALWQCLAQVTAAGSELYFSYKRRGLGEAAFVARLHRDKRYRVVEVPPEALDPEFRDGTSRITVLRAVRL